MKYYEYLLKIRCENNYQLWSNWSEPTLLKKYPDHDPECRGIQPAPSSNPPPPASSTAATTQHQGI